jgi:uncharacterized repeat protein (TIGR03843 family)
MPIELTEEQVLSVLQEGALLEKGRLPYSSNHSFLVLAETPALALPAVYKPQRGESPLWDFEWGTLCKRETAAYLISRELGWNLVPPTILRDGPQGLGTVQFYIDHEPDAHYFTVAQDARFTTSFRQIALFDWILNNADRKSGHCLVGGSRIWAIDHGLGFHVEYKLRTVIWEFAGEPIERKLMAALEGLQETFHDPASAFSRTLGELLDRAEVRGTRKRLDFLLKRRRFPDPIPQRRNFPWPPI